MNSMSFGHQLVRSLVRNLSNPLLRNVSRPLPLLTRCFALDAKTAENIESLVKKQTVVVFMKGEKDSPRCGFSNAVTQILRMHGVDYEGVNVLADDDLRQGIKEFSQWPTIPQIFINGEFVGGCDILIQMHQNGELCSLLQKNGIQSQLADAATADEK